MLLLLFFVVLGCCCDAEMTGEDEMKMMKMKTVMKMLNITTVESSLESHDVDEGRR